MSKNWKKFTPFYFYGPIVTALGTAATVMRGSRSIGNIALLLAVGLLTWGMIEYCLHRFAFHFEARSKRAREFVYAMHLSHHEKPKAMDDLFANLSFSVPIAALYCLLAWAITGSWQAMAFLYVGMTAGYFGYEFLHYQAHHLSPRLGIFRYLKRYHMLHHFQTPDLRFGVTSPLFDYLFGTFKPARKSRSRATAAR